MARQQNPDLEILEAAVAQLGPLADQMVSLGGCATGLLLTDDAALMSLHHGNLARYRIRPSEFREWREGWR